MPPDKNCGRIAASNSNSAAVCFGFRGQFGSFLFPGPASDGAVHQVGNKGGEPGNIGNQQQHSNGHANERPNLPDHIRRLHFQQAGHHEDIGAEGRRNGGQAAVEAHHQTEVDDVDPQGANHRGQQRRNDDHGRHGVHKAADDQKQDVAQDKEHVLVAGEGEQQLGQLGWNSLPGHIVAEQVRGAEDHHDRGRGVHRLQQDLRQLPQFQFLVDELAHKDGVEGHHYAALGGGADAEAQQHDQAEGQEQRPQCGKEQAHQLLARHHLISAAHIAPLLGDHIVQNHERNRQQDTGEVARRQQAPNGALAHAGKQDQVDSGRDDGGDAGRGGGNGRGIGLAVAVFQHLRHKDLALHGAVRRAGAGDTAHQGGDQNVHMAQAAGEMPHQTIRKLHQLLGNAGVVHDAASGDEKGDGHQRLGFTGSQQLLGNYGGAYVGVRQEVGNADDHHGEGAGNPQEKQPQHDKYGP